MSTDARPRPALSDYLGGMVVFNAAMHVAIAAAIGSLAVSRAQAHVLSPAALAVVVALATVGTVAFAWPSGAYGGAYDAITGGVRLPAADDAGGADPFAGRRAWSAGARWGLTAGLWAAAGGGLVVVALNQQRARWVVIATTWAVLAGGAAVATDTFARRRGVLAAARHVATAATPMRHRAWREVALPLAIVQGGINSVVGWVLFHDYAPGALTDKVALADATFVIVLLTSVFGFVVRRWGAVDAALGRIAPDDPDAPAVSAKAPLGRQGLVYVAVAAVLVVRLVVILLPATPSLAVVIVTRGLFTGALVFAVAGVAYVRGALNPITAGRR
jgi:hypothetical protein